MEVNRTATETFVTDVKTLERSVDDTGKIFPYKTLYGSFHVVDKVFRVKVRICNSTCVPRANHNKRSGRWFKKGLDTIIKNTLFS